MRRMDRYRDDNDDLTKRYVKNQELYQDVMNNILILLMLQIPMFMKLIIQKKIKKKIIILVNHINR